MQKAKLFMNGKSQAVRLPKEFRFQGDFVYVRRQGDEVILSTQPFSWDDFFQGPKVFGEDFLADREQEVSQERTWF